MSFGSRALKLFYSLLIPHNRVFDVACNMVYEGNSFNDFDFLLQNTQNFAKKSPEGMVKSTLSGVIILFCLIV